MLALKRYGPTPGKEGNYPILPKEWNHKTHTSHG